jgi:predicted branched-subunit amino acid permease
MNAKNACAVLLGIVFLAIFIALVVPHAQTWPAIVPASPAAGVALWKDRTYEALLQGMIVLAGVLSILLLLGRNQSGRMQP